MLSSEKLSNSFLIERNFFLTQAKIEHVTSELLLFKA